MKTRMLVLGLVLVFLLGVTVSPASASITPGSFSLIVNFTGASSSNCGTGGYIAFSTSVTFGGGMNHTQVATVTDGQGNVLYSQSGPTFPDGTYNSYGSFVYSATPTQNPITATVVFDGTAYTGKADNPCLPSSGLGGWFSPGDDRVDPRPGDRVAVYCRADKLTVYGILNDSKGAFLATFSHADLIKAGAKGITKRVEPLGTIFASLSGTSSFYVRWTGGPAAATGVKDFAKAFVCNLS